MTINNIETAMNRRSTLNCGFAERTTVIRIVFVMQAIKVRLKVV
ncbi:hypothetical protein [Paenibacillus sp. L3-i20]|nr:hypothetical protein [Paenibacillus sp. L3-i20]